MKTKIGLGCASLSGEGGGYGFGDICEKTAISLVRHAIDRGIEYFDTAPIYGFDLSEKRLGMAIGHIDRENVKIVSKCGVHWHNTKRVNMTNDPKLCDQQLTKSLRHLATDYIDLYMVHWPDPKIDIRYTVEALVKRLDKDDILEIGLCNTNQNEIDLASEVYPIRSLQGECNLFSDSMKAFEQFFKMGWGSFDKGILSGRVELDRKFDASDCRSWAPWWKKGNWKEKVQKCNDFSHKAMLKNIAFHYAIKNTDIALFGAKTIQDLDDLLNIEKTKIDNDLIDKASDYFGKKS